MSRTTPPQIKTMRSQKECLAILNYNSNYLLQKPLPAFHATQHQRLAYGVKISLTFGLIFGANCLFAFRSACPRGVPFLSVEK